MLANKWDSDKATYPCYLQPKLRGIRAKYFNGQFVSRDLCFFNQDVVEHLIKQMQELLRKFPLIDYPIDGEFYKHGWTEQRINSAIGVRRITPTADSREVEFHVFDVENKQSQNDRLMTTGILFTYKPEVCTHIQRVWTVDIPREEQLFKWHKHFIDIEKYEGSMYRSRHGHYEPATSKSTGKSWNLMKIKEFEDDEFKVIGVTEGQDSFKTGVGALVCETKDGKTFKISSGIDDEDRFHWGRHPDQIVGQTIKLAFEMYSKDGIPLKPRIA